MKHKTQYLYYLYYPRGWIIITLLLFIATATAQEQTPPPEEFPIATPVADTLISNSDLFNSFKATGFNTIWQRADNTTKNLLKNYDLLAVNAFSKMEYIYHYTTGYYSKWEAEQNQTDQSRVGVKHIGGSKVYYDSAWCWSTIGLSAPACSLMFGPHYRQEKRYKRWHYGCTSGEGCVTYTPRFRMALDNKWNVESEENVCIIKVIFRYKIPNTTTFIDYPFIERTLKVGDFDINGNFEDFYLHPNKDSARYEYWPYFILPDKFAQAPDAPMPVSYIDWESFTGIQFWVDWLRTDTLCTLYIDYAEVYDNNGWNDFIEDPDGTAYKITSYADSFKTMGWNNIKYWIGTNEPYTIDSYTPIHIVDSLISSYPIQAPNLAVHFDPSWTHNFNINGEDDIEMFNKIAKREELPIGLLPIDLNYIRSYSFKSLKRRIYFEMR